MEVLTLNLYSFDELSEIAQENVVRSYKEDIGHIIDGYRQSTLSKINKLFLANGFDKNSLLIRLEPYGNIKINGDFSGKLFDLFLKQHVVDNIGKSDKRPFVGWHTDSDIVEAFWNEYEKPIDERKSYQEFIKFLKEKVDAEFAKWRIDGHKLADYQKKWLTRILPDNVFLENGDVFNSDKVIKCNLKVALENVGKENGLI